MPEPVIQVAGLSKRYRIGSAERYRALRDVMSTVASGTWRCLRGRVRGTSAAPTPDPGELWALKDVSFEVGAGEVLGVIGSNGAGKTTLLRILSRITVPTEGRARIRGRVGSLLEVGTGFHPELTGRENIHLNGAILGMRRREIAGKFDAIVEFSGVERFIDTPVKHYSTGMRMRLAFSVAAYLEPEILLIDEVLAVGDAAFQQKCLGKMNEVASGGRTILFVSHNMGAVKSLCSRALWLDQGCVARWGVVGDVVDAYLASTRCGPQVASGIRRAGRAPERVHAVSFHAQAAGKPGIEPGTGSPAELVLGYEGSGGRPILRLHALIAVKDQRGVPVFGCATASTSLRYFNDLPPTGQLACRIGQLPLRPGRYTVDIELKDDEGVADYVTDAAAFTVVDGGDSGLLFLPPERYGSAAVPHEWRWLGEPEPAHVQ